MLTTSLARRSALGVTKNAFRSVSAWAAVPAGPPDPILGVTEAFKADKDPRKINLGVGAYRDEQGKPYILPSVKKAEELVRTSLPDKEYLPITGLADFTKNAALLAYGADSEPLKQGAISVTQSISGTGALRIGGAFLARHYPHSKAIYLPVPTWGNHIPLFQDSGLEVRGYRYYDKDTVGLDFEGLKADLKAAPEQSIVLLHACAHNPTGVDPTPAQWAEISDIIKEKKLFPFFDMAYQGFASGNTTKDAFAVRHFVSQGHQIALAQSFAKNMGLYGERIGAFSLTTASPEEKARVDSQLKIVIRPMYSNPPLHGARIANTILSTPELYTQWEGEVKGMADRIISMREKLYNALTHDLKTPGEWGHIKSQIGMFSFTGLTAPQTKVLAEKAHVYMTSNGRISMAGLNGGNIQYFAESVDKADPDTTLQANMILISPRKGTENADATMGSLHHAELSFGSTELASSLHGSSTGDATLSDIASSEASLRRSGSSSTKASRVVLDRDSLASVSRFQAEVPPEISISRGSPRSIAAARLSASSYMHDADDDGSRLSAYSNYSAPDYAGLHNFLRHRAAESSEESIGLRPPGSGEFERHTRRRRIIEANNYEPPTGSLLLSQPDGNNPWTLSLDPSLTSESVSQSSASCRSVTTSLASENERPSNRHTPSPSFDSSSPQLNPAFLRPAFHHPYGGDFPDAEVSTTRQGSHMSIRDERREYSTVEISQKAPAAPKKALKKTKQFYLKIKKLFTPKASTSSRSITRRALNDSSLGRSQGLYVFPGTDVQQAVPSLRCNSDTPSTQGFPQPQTPSQSSIYRRPFTRSLKLSSPSVALSYTPDRTSNYPASSVEERFTYEYHARPRTLSEIKSKRRFSLPTIFTKPTASRPNSSSGRTVNASRTNIPEDSLGQGDSQHLRPTYA
ncbi:hypothetical protein NLJ89_g6152 [Agrocybe chaxingu]|uniref:Aspartate aminotransferase n=1 Tax=Agrocybe chaxingu TaxID=84603 RepID=A0A9W8JZ78_9AGAR|nr:hypothetical protein NLJ89_g6152 [Agrocybe chaxingu]